MSSSGKMTYRLSNGIVIFFLMLVIYLCVRAGVREDVRFSWGMFSDSIHFTVRYHLVLEDGTKIRHRTGDELQKDNRIIRDSVKGRHTRYGIGSIRDWVKGYIRYVYETRKSKDIVCC